MSETEKRDTAEMRYVLGDLSEDEKTRMEEAFLTDDAKFDELELAEDELVDAYVSNELSHEERRRFNARLKSSPRLVERVSFARTLAEKADSLSQESEPSIEPARLFSSPTAKPKARWWGGYFAQRPAFGMPLAACAMLILVVGIVLVSGWLRLRSESERRASEQADLQRQKEALQQSTNLRESPTPDSQQSTNLRESTNQDLQRSTNLREPQTRQPVLATVFLRPGSLRGSGGQPELTIGAKTTNARLQLALEKNDYPTYSATIKTPEGRVVFRKNGLKPHNGGSGAHLLLSVPARSLAEGDYIAHVDGVTASGQVESVNDYPFRVVNREVSFLTHPLSLIYELRS